MKRDQTRHKRSRKKNGRFIFFTVLVIAIFFTTGVVFGSLYYMASGLTTTDLPEDNVSLGISETAEKDSNIVNIALFGVDARDNSDSGRSDAIIVLSTDSATGQIKMTSILRDSKVQVEGQGETKLNHAYAYGGPALAVKTLNQNYHLDIKEYVTVNFYQLADLVDALGGVTLNLTAAEVKSANENLLAVHPKAATISGSGDIHLNGDQAVAYSRIRDIDSDNARTGRQQEVLSAMLKKVKEMKKSEYPSFIKQFLALVETSLNYSDLIGLSPIMLKGNLDIVQNTIPDEQLDNVRGGIGSDGVWYWLYDLDAASARLHDIIYED